jgi:hypothetical protein
MIAQLPADRMPPPRPTGISRFERLFRVAAGLDIDKSDIKRHEDFVNRKIYDLLICAEETARLNGRDDRAAADPRLHRKTAAARPRL